MSLLLVTGAFQACYPQTPEPFLRSGQVPDRRILMGCLKCLPSEQEPVESASGVHAWVGENL